MAAYLYIYAIRVFHTCPKNHIMAEHNRSCPNKRLKLKGSEEKKQMRRVNDVLCFWFCINHHHTSIRITNYYHMQHDWPGQNEMNRSDRRSKGEVTIKMK